MWLCGYLVSTDYEGLPQTQKKLLRNFLNKITMLRPFCVPVALMGPTPQSVSDPTASLVSAQQRARACFRPCFLDRTATGPPSTAVWEATLMGCRDVHWGFGDGSIFFCCPSEEWPDAQSPLPSAVRSQTLGKVLTEAFKRAIFQQRSLKL